MPARSRPPAGTNPARALGRDRHRDYGGRDAAVRATPGEGGPHVVAPLGAGCGQNLPASTRAIVTRETWKVSRTGLTPAGLD
ncbi:MAG TPA: hypothetical protein VGD68_03410, partial [Streptosporangiaceae bacterium]